MNLKKKNSNKSKNEDIVSVVSFRSTLSAVSTSMRNAVGTVGNTLDMMLESIPMSSDEDDSDFESAESAESVESDYEYNDDSNKRGQSFVKKVKRVMHKKMSQTDNETCCICCGVALYELEEEGTCAHAVVAALI